MRGKMRDEESKERLSPPVSSVEDGMSGSPAPVSSSSGARKGSATPVVAARQSVAPTKPVNVFSNDGSFMSRFKKEKEEVAVKTKQEESLAR